MRMTTRSRRLRLTAAASLALTFAAVLVTLLVPAPAVREGDVVLGAARRHSPSPVDTVARLSKGALAAAAGSSEVALNRDTVLVPSDVELAFVQLVNADRAANGLGPLEY